MEKSSLAFEGKHNAGDVNLEVAAEDFYLQLGQGRSTREIMLRGGEEDAAEVHSKV